MSITAESVRTVGRRIDVASVPSVPAAGFTTSGHLGWRQSGDGVDLVHTFTAGSISDGAAVTALSDLVHAGIIVGQDEFESAMVGLIATCCDDPSDGWLAFYANSIEDLRSGRSVFSPVHRRARSLVVGRSVLEVGCCFGLFAVQCAQDGLDVQACDICPGALALLDDASARLGVDVRTALGDARALPVPDDRVDTVTLIHLLEHLSSHDVTTAIREALRVARQRVVIAVPFEDEPSAHFGHLQRLSEDDLLRWAAPWIRSGLAVTVFTDHGGWLVIDKQW
ncbi:mycofactocin oligosaccharide methyltransferase MftM [Gordonia sp. MP11Mi]|uniref:Methyltransferase type 11 domain-containing protein n=1 Tax=Gordonia sp. MP11Mi TaxID=3022769 RepID=A0AA97CRI7_9ACTN